MKEKLNRYATPCYCLRARRLSFDLAKFYDHVLDPCGVTAGQYSLLLNIFAAGQCSIRELADATELDRSTLARTLKPLLNSRLVIDTRQAGARNCQLELTAFGYDTMEKARMLWGEAQEAVKQQLGEDGITAFEKALNALAGL